MLLLTSSFSLLLILVGITPALAQSRPPPGAVSIAGVSVDNGDSGSGPNPAMAGTDGGDDGTSQDGTGCKAGSVGSTLAADNSFMTLIFDDFEADIGPGIKANKNKRFCKVKVDLTAPAGWTYDIEAADYRGYANLDKGVNATLTSTYGFQGQSTQSNIQKIISGPTSDDYLIHQANDVNSKVWFPCGKSQSTLSINTQIQLTAATKRVTGSITADTLDAKFAQNLTLGWKKC